MSRRTLALAVLSGALLAASFPSVDLTFLAWIALVPLFLALRGLNAKEAFSAGMVSGIVFFGGTIPWITNSIHSYGPLPLVPAAFITLLLCTYCAIYPALFCAVVVHLRQSHPAVVFLSAPAAWVMLELARTHLFTGFPWALLGYSQYRHLPVIQVADITGVYGISFLIALVNHGIAQLIGDRRRYLPLAAAAGVAIAVLGYGCFRLSAPAGTGSIRIAVVQGNIEQDRKWNPAYQAGTIAAYKRMTLKALKEKPDIVIWPETATPFYFGGSGGNAVKTDDLRRFVAATGTPLLTGSPTFEREDRADVLRNSAFFLDGQGAIDAIYTKHHLVPFGEYVPLKSSLLFFVDKLVQATGDFEAGSEYTIVGVRSAADDKNILLSTVICYEIIFPDLVRRFVDRGAAVMTTITNDAWFGRSSAPYQHFAMAVLRAVENRVPVARAANTGVSGFIDAKGRILETSDIFTEAVLTRTLIPGSTRTFYTRYGDVFAWLCLLGTILSVLPLPQRR
ncbi:MAG: apolipoprotein N-acyltransferase [Nitrospirota bacterium]